MQTLMIDSLVGRAARWSSVGVLLAALVPAGAGAQDSASLAAASASVPVRDVSGVIARTAQPLGGATSVRVLSDGSIFVNDTQRRRLLRFDASLGNPVVVADTAPGGLMPYGMRPLGLMPYLGDSTIVVDPSTMSLVVLDARGRTVRVMASPRTNDINTLAGANLGSHAFDAKGRLYYRQGAGGGGANMFGSGNEGGRGGNGGGRGQGGPGGGPGHCRGHQPRHPHPVSLNLRTIPWTLPAMIGPRSA